MRRRRNPPRIKPGSIRPSQSCKNIERMNRISVTRMIELAEARGIDTTEWFLERTIYGGHLIAFLHMPNLRRHHAHILRSMFKLVAQTQRFHSEWMGDRIRLVSMDRCRPGEGLVNDPPRMTEWLDIIAHRPARGRANPSKARCADMRRRAEQLAKDVGRHMRDWMPDETFLWSVSAATVLNGSLVVVVDHPPMLGHGNVNWNDDRYDRAVKSIARMCKLRGFGFEPVQTFDQMSKRLKPNGAYSYALYALQDCDD